jgi:hypothetical protein
VPATFGVPERDRGLLARKTLLGGGTLRGAARLVVRAEGFGIDAFDLVGPASIMLDDPVDDLAFWLSL